MKTQKARWIHFTKDSYDFDLTPGGGEAISREYGLFVYRYNDRFPVEERQREWAYRDPIIIECDRRYVELVQTDPLGNDRSRDEYAIPAKHFNKCEWWRL